MNTFETLAEYEDAIKMYNINQEAVRKYCQENKTNGIPSEIAKTFPFADIVDNYLRSKIEVWEWLHEKPQSYFLYIKQETGKAINWMGEILGTVGFGKEYRDNFGGVRVPINVSGNNGVLYHGIYYKSSGEYARIKAFKHQ